MEGIDPGGHPKRDRETVSGEQARSSKPHPIRRRRRDRGLTNRDTRNQDKR